MTEWLDARNIAIRHSASPRVLLSHAVRAAENYGIGRRYLSNFDCFHYAEAKTAGVPLLTLDNLLRATDIETQPPSVPTPDVIL